MTIEDDLSRLGHAPVMVVLKPQVMRRWHGRAMLSLEETKDVQQEVAHKLRQHFRTFRNSRLSLSAKLTPALEGDADGPLEKVDQRVQAAVGDTNSVRYYPNLGLMYGTVDKAGWAALSLEDDVAEVAVPPQLSLIQPAEDAALAGPEEGMSWALRRLRIDELWSKGLTGDGVLIGHSDTGVDATHPALTDKVDAFAYFDASGRQVAGARPADTGFHGTHTAGILVGGPVDGVTFGVAPGAKLVSASVIEDGDVPSRVFGSLNWLVAQGVRLVSLSLGVRGFAPQLATVMQILRQRDMLPIVAIGNEGVQTSRTPGNLPEALSVGAMNQNDELWDRSSSQQIVEPPKRTVPTLIGPGAGIWSCVPNAQMRSLSGTSMAAPHIAGLAALLLQRRPDITIMNLERAIVGSCTRPVGISTSRGNKGVPDAVKALALLEQK